MKNFIKTSIILLSAVILTAGSAIAVPLSSEYELFTGDVIGAPTYKPGIDLGYFIWADDAAQRSWHIRWSGNGPAEVHTFNGNIALSENSMTTSAFSFETSTSYTDSFLQINAQSLLYLAFANTGEDGLDFQITGDVMPSYLGFDLFIDGGSDIAHQIFIGAANLNPESQDFKVAAPVPEPATLLLIGTGIVSLAGFRRRKLKKK